MTQSLLAFLNGPTMGTELIPDFPVFAPDKGKGQTVRRDAATSLPLGTADWQIVTPAVAPTYRKGDFWAGYLPTGDVLGVRDDRHVLIAGGTRGGKGTSVIVPNLCLWPGSIVVNDPKGENAMVTARRRGNGSPRTKGMGQKVYLLDPFGAVKTDDDDFSDIRVGFNPLDVVVAAGREAPEEAGRIAEALVVSEHSKEPFWDDSARSLLRALILHVATWDAYAKERNLLTVYRLLMAGKAELRSFMAMNDPEGLAPSGHDLLFDEMQRNPACNGVVASAGSWFWDLSHKNEKTFMGVMQVAQTNMDFLAGETMNRCLEKSDFSLSELKTNPRGISLFICLPQRYMETHFRWLRMMTTLIIGEMEKVQHQPRSGHQVMMVLDEFAGLKRMRTIENAAAQIAGFGVKLVFIVQTLAQLKDTYKDNWETLLANAGTKMFFGNDDHFTREYASKLVGDTETIREARNNSETRGWSSGESTTDSTSTSESRSWSVSSGPNGTWSSSSSYSQGSSYSWTRQKSDTWSSSETTGTSETVQKRPFFTPDEIGRLFGNPRNPAALVLISGQQPIAVRRVEYFRQENFAGFYDTHRDHPKPPTLFQLAIRIAEERKRRDRAARLAAKQEAERRRRQQEERRRQAQEDAARKERIERAKKTLERMRKAKERRRELAAQAAAFLLAPACWSGWTWGVPYVRELLAYLI